MTSDAELKREAQETLILLVLGSVHDKNDKKISILHLEKEVFILWNFHSLIKELINFIAYYKGPYSSEIRDIIINPMYFTDSWEYITPERKDKLSGGYVILTEQGVNKYKQCYKSILKDNDLHSLLAGIKIVRTLYGDLTDEELLLLIYDTYPKYIKKSEVANDIYMNRTVLSKRLYERGIISEEKAKYLQNAVW
ncbi:MAG TPA: hypothetical protein O0W90_00090 [Methanocorpusculum sp.]|nr:hypothetical protein [Methanocorpusculum sp.]